MRREIVPLIAAIAVACAGLAMATVATMANLANAQTPAAPASPQPSNTQTITVRGCINGRSLHVPPRPNDRDLLIAPSTYRLKGAKAMMALLEEHDGHQDEIAGTTQVADTKRSKAVKEKTIGRGRVYVEAGSDKQPGGIQSTEDFTIEVTSIVHMKPNCA